MTSRERISAAQSHRLPDGPPSDVGALDAPLGHR